MDRAMTKAALGENGTAPNPTDRGNILRGPLPFGWLPLETLLWQRLLLWP